LGEDTASIVVSGFGNPPEAVFTYSPAEPKAGLETLFDASSSNPNGGTIVSYEWDFGDGNTTTTTNTIVSHTHENPGIYNISLKVTDSESFFDVFLETITVIPSAVYEHDVAITVLTATPTMLQIGDTVHITVTAKNVGNATETFNVTTTYGSYSNVETVIDLLPEEHVTFNYDWLTSAETKCVHTINAVAEQVAGETYVHNNQRSVGVYLVELIPSEATVKVEPALVKSLRFFEVNITIEDLEEYWDMAGFDISLNYNTTMLDVIEVDLGEFATRFNLTFEIVKDQNDLAGYVHLAYMWNFAELTPETRPTPFGSGTLFTARFYVAAAGTTELLLDTTIAAYPNPSKWCTDSSIPVTCLTLSGIAQTALPIKEDVNADGKVDILDVVLAAAAYGSHPDHPNWNPYADLNGDGVITILDLVMITRIYGTIYDP
jgi:PKD repeat protein